MKSGRVVSGNQATDTRAFRLSPHSGRPRAREHTAHHRSHLEFVEAVFEGWLDAEGAAAQLQLHRQAEARPVDPRLHFSSDPAADFGDRGQLWVFIGVYYHRNDRFPRRTLGFCSAFHVEAERHIPMHEGDDPDEGEQWEKEKAAQGQRNR